jgi:crossover junction endodeoxyribonuclease RuvC
MRGRDVRPDGLRFHANGPPDRLRDDPLPSLDHGSPRTFGDGPLRIFGDSPLRIFGIDPGSRATGFGVVERRGSRVVHVAHGTLRARCGTLAERLAELHGALAHVIEEHRPEAVVVERVFAGRSARSALVLGHARGVALAAAAAATRLPVHEYTAPEIKLAVVGTGNAEKRQVQLMVARLLGLAEPPAADAADALAAALCHAHRGPLAALGPAGPRPRARSAGAGRLVVRRPR